MYKQMRNPLLIEEVSKVVDYLPWRFNLSYTVALKTPENTDEWQKVYNHAINRLFVHDQPAQIKRRRLTPAYWYSIAQDWAGDDSPILFHGQICVPRYGRCGDYITQGHCVPGSLYLETALRLNGMEAAVVVTPTASFENTPEYTLRWEPDVADITWTFVGLHTDEVRARFANLGVPREVAAMAFPRMNARPREPKGIELLYDVT